MEKEIKIDIPEGYEIDKENSDFTCIKFKKIEKDEFEYVDLGLPSSTLWATCNVGAKKPEEYGEYLKWDDAQKYNCPSVEKIDELIEKCKWVECKINDVNGYIVIGKNGNHIFLPSAGNRYSRSIYDTGSSGYYWSNSLFVSASCDASSLYFDFGSIYCHNRSRCRGLSVRPIKNK